MCGARTVGFLQIGLVWPGVFGVHAPLDKQTTQPTKAIATVEHHPPAAIK